ncbi:hypothetical protein AGMMS50229_15970 [Campylobacterota bacterium]|nr:hypothetical protein AGMMS50229_15970 [Campylobacterota bacterium]
MLILLAGGGGYVGQSIIGRFSQAHSFLNVSLSRSADFALNNILVDLAKPLSFLKFDRPIDMIINCVECHPETYENTEKMKRAYLASVRHLIEYAKENNIPRFIHFSINHINTVQNDYQQAKFVAEGLIRNSGLEYVILKPSVIFGHNSPFEYFIDSLLKRTILFRFWDDKIKIAPIHLYDVLSNIAYLFENGYCWKETYHLTGPEILSFEEILGRNRGKVPTILSAPTSEIARKSALGFLPNQLSLLIDWVNEGSSELTHMLLRSERFYTH